ncbi:MAG: hypothetical protein ABMA64_08210 [Myxococcota bacterium]
MSRIGMWLALGAAGCGGKGGSDSGSTASGDDDDAVSGDPCAEVLFFDTTGMGCDQLGSAFEQMMGSATTCDIDSDCAIVKPQCEDWVEVGCWYPYNRSCVESAEIAKYNSAAATINCNPPIGSRGECECGAAPEVMCVEHRCCSPVLDYFCVK